MMTPHCDLLLTGGRVIDPETGLDAVRAVGIRGGSIVHVGDPTVSATRTLDVAGLVVAPGFIDLHSHAQCLSGLRLQAHDGVTTALELEAGALPVDAQLRWAEWRGRPINVGFSAGWAFARMRVMDGIALTTPQEDPQFGRGEELFNRYQAFPGWHEPAGPKQLAAILDLLRAEIDSGAIGIGVLLGYAPRTAPAEFAALAALGAELGQPLFVHARSLSPTGTPNSLDAVLELIAAARTHGTHIHLCHMNSTSGLLADQIADAVLQAQQEGVQITTEAYPFGTGSTAIGAEFLAPDELTRSGLRPSSITYLVTGERIADAERLAEIRAADPGGPCLVDILDVADPAQRNLLLRCLTFPDVAFASDACVANYWGPEEGRAAAEAAIDDDVWPLPEGLISHPRSSGCYSRVLSWLVRDTAAMSLAEAVRRSSLLPAQLLEQSVPAMRRKGRVQIGADADLVVFNPATVAPQGGFTRLLPSRGFAHVLVGGQPIIEHGTLKRASMPGSAIRGAVEYWG